MKNWSEAMEVAEYIQINGTMESDRKAGCFLKEAISEIEQLRQDKAELEKQLNKILDNWD